MTFYGGSGGIQCIRTEIIPTARMPKKRRQGALDESVCELPNIPNTSQISPSSTIIKPCPFFGNLDEDFDKEL